MSDLAPFVAALLRDDVVDDLKAENDNLRSENAKTRAFVLESTKTGGCLQITGQGGSPVYAHASLNNARFQFIDTDVHHNTVNCFKLGLTPNSDYMCQLSKVCHAELRVNGIKVATLGEGDSGNYGWNSEYYGADVSGMNIRNTYSITGFLVCTGVESKCLYILVLFHQITQTWWICASTITRHKLP